jgi:hypothetical protein
MTRWNLGLVFWGVLGGVRVGRIVVRKSGLFPSRWLRYDPSNVGNVRGRSGVFPEICPSTTSCGTCGSSLASEINLIIDTLDLPSGDEAQQQDRSGDGWTDEGVDVF